MDDRLGGGGGVAARDPQVVQQLARASSVLAEVTQAVAELEKRLNSVLRQIPPLPGNDSIKEAEESLVPVANSINALRTEGRKIRAMVTSILDRLEV